jgi:hypothetical protein
MKQFQVMLSSLDKGKRKKWRKLIFKIAGCGWKKKKIAWPKSQDCPYSELKIVRRKTMMKTSRGWPKANSKRGAANLTAKMSLVLTRPTHGLSLRPSSWLFRRWAIWRRQLMAAYTGLVLLYLTKTLRLTSKRNVGTIGTPLWSILPEKKFSLWSRTECEGLSLNSLISRRYRFNARNNVLSWRSTCKSTQISSLLASLRVAGAVRESCWFRNTPIFRKTYLRT